MTRTIGVGLLEGNVLRGAAEVGDEHDVKCAGHTIGNGKRFGGGSGVAAPVSPR